MNQMNIGQQFQIKKDFNQIQINNNQSQYSMNDLNQSASQQSQIWKIEKNNM